MSSSFKWVQLARRFIPRKMRFAIQRVVSLQKLKLKWRESTNPIATITHGDDNEFGSSVRFGIVRNAAQYHSYFVRACMEMSVPFRVIDLYCSDWLKQVENSGCDVLLVWPDGFLDSWNAMIKDRVAILEHEMGYPAVPSSDELWMYEDKRRTAYWLAANGFPHPETWVFYNEEEARKFAETCELPIVFKTSFGAGASGVQILRNRRSVYSLIRKAFSRGISPGGTDFRDRQWGNIIFQEYLNDVQEWRMVRIGDSYFGHPKGRVGEFHSGSGSVLWDAPSPRHLNLVREITECGGFRSMDVDIFETGDGQLFVNELQAVFGASYAVDQLKIDGKPGRFIWRDGEWIFEPGEFARNACANERLRDALQRGLRRSHPTSSVNPQQKITVGDSDV